jgi:hypothetical protein
VYLTAQRVCDQVGREEVHSFLHWHDLPEYPFPVNPLDVPQHAPGRLVHAWPPQPALARGGNAVVAYVDIMAQDYLWSPHWLVAIRAHVVTLHQWALPAAFRFGPVHAVYYAAHRAAEVPELQALIDTAHALLGAFNPPDPYFR